MADEENLELETLEVETRVVEEISEVVPPPGWIESQERKLAQKIREQGR